MASDPDPDHLANLRNLRSVVEDNLRLQHYWTDLTMLDTVADVQGGNIDGGSDAPLLRPMIHGRPPEQLYDPEHAASNSSTGKAPKPTPELEYVFPVHIDELFSLRKWAAVFDSLPKPHEGAERRKRIVVAVVSGDSTVVYYIMHDGIVKPRQN
ncbi:hypothetical protein Dda_6106 [Drechslerella dactyloides]|uniref:tRNA-splicing endonuclease subunit Sen15 domain-containing protein n=1 Tax=Drechslerella dactyloides TaxID=74499 RepID=A0AAD6NJM5_DREDA|nr:hypothetical protein Dda_6106 [Drechslerella dactyloides]